MKKRVKRAFQAMTAGSFVPLSEVLTPEFTQQVREKSEKQHGNAPNKKAGDGWEGVITGSACPVQIHGTAYGGYFYFRARCDAWSFEWWRNEPVRDHLPERDADFLIEEEYGDGFDASWMPHAEAWEKV